MLLGLVENESDFGDELFELRQDFKSKFAVDGAGPLGGGKAVFGGGFDRELGVAEKTARGFQTMEGVSGKERLGGPIFGIVDVEGTGEFRGSGRDAAPGFIQGMLGRGTFRNPSSGLGGVVHGDGEFAATLHERVVIGFAEAGIFLKVFEGLFGEGVEFVDTGIPGGLLLGSEGWRLCLAALDAELFAFLPPDFIEVVGVGVFAHHAGLDAVEEEVHARGLGIGLGFEPTLGLVIGVVGGGEFDQTLGEGGAKRIREVERGGLVRLALSDFVIGRHDPRGLGVDGNLESGGLDDDAPVRIAEPFEVEGIFPMVGDGLVLFVVETKILERAVEDLDLARGGDVADAAGLVRKQCWSGFEGRRGVFKTTR